MTETTTAVSLTTPPQKLIDFFNPVVRGVLRSPLHAAVDKAFLMLHITGRKSGRHYDIPVSYLDLDGHLLAVTHHVWRANLRGGADIEVTYRGRRQPARAELDENPASVAATLHRLTERIGMQAAKRQFGLDIHVDRMPTVAELEAAVREHGLTTITLTIG